MKEVEDEPTNLGEFIAAQRFSKEEKDAHAKIITDFTNLYYGHKVQTWCNTKWRGIPVCKTPTDLWVYQELIEELKPELIIETGTLFGGSALFLRDIMNLLDDVNHVISIDIDHSKVFPKAKNTEGIWFLEGSSVSDETVQAIKEYVDINDIKSVMVILDSDHTEQHVLNELNVLAPLVTKGSALIVEDTNTPGPGEAIEQWAPFHNEFKVSYMCEKFMLTFNRGGYFERIT